MRDEERQRTTCLPSSLIPHPSSLPKKGPTVNATFACPACDAPVRVKVNGPLAWQCPACDHRLTLDPARDGRLSECLVCGNRELYRKKDFPHGLGMTILVVACIASAFAYGWYKPWLTWTILIGTALFDGLLYLSREDGTTFIIRTADQSVVANNPLAAEEFMVSSPVLVDGRIYLRTFERIRCVETPGKSVSSR